MHVQKLSTEECHLALKNAGFGRLACSCDNQPYIVPTYFIVADNHIYAFALPGKKLKFMRANPHVCVEIDDVNRRNDWISVVVLGRYEELPDTLEYDHLRKYAHALLQERPMWWEPGAVTVADRSETQGFVPVYYRISIDRMTGHRAAASPDRTPTGG